MKRLFTLLSLLIAALNSFAQSFTIDDLTYSILSADDKTVSVSDGKNATGDVIVPSTVTYEDVEYSVTTIGNEAFNGNTNITSIAVPSVTTIKDYAFCNCSSLSFVDFPIATSIGRYAFSNNTSLTTVKLPAVISIGYWYPSPSLSIAGLIIKYYLCSRFKNQEL